MFFHAGVVEAVTWKTATDTSLVTITASTSLPNDSNLAYNYNPYWYYDNPDYETIGHNDYYTGGTSVFSHTVYYNIDASTFGWKKTSNGSMIVVLKDHPVFSTMPSSFASNITDIQISSSFDGLSPIIQGVDFSEASSDTTLRLALYFNDVYCYEAFRISVAVTYDVVCYWPTNSMPLSSAATYYSSGSCSLLNVQYTSGKVLSSEAESQMQHQESIAESQAQQQSQHHQEQMQQQESIAESQAQQSQEQHEENIGFFSKIVKGILDLPALILDVLVSVFVPDAEYFSSLFDEMNTFFSERFGLLYYPFDIIIDFANLFLSSSAGGGSVPFPEIKWEGTTIISAQDVEIIQDDSFLVLQERLYFVGNVIMVGALINLAHKKINEVMKA